MWSSGSSGLWSIAVCSVLYIQKGIPFKAGLYGLYVVIAVVGYFKWMKMRKITKYEKV